MKKLLPIIFILILSSCSVEEPIPLETVNIDDIVEREGIFYKVNSKQPFLGMSQEYIDSNLIKRTYKDGKVMESEESYIGRNETVIENVTKYSEDGDIVEMRDFNNGKLSYVMRFSELETEGIQEDYHENGQLKCKSDEQKGVTVFSECFYPNGLLEFKYFPGKKYNLEVYYEKDGEIKERSCYTKTDGETEWVEPSLCKDLN